MALPAAQYNYGETPDARPGRIMVELHDEAITALSEAIQAIAEEEIEKRFNETAAAMQAVTALYTMLDHDNGGVLASNLGRIYSDVLGKLSRISFSNDPALAADSIALLQPLRAAWDDLDRREHDDAEPEAGQQDHARAIVSGARAKSFGSDSTSL